VRDRNDRDCRDPDQHDDQNLEESSRFDQFEMLFQFAIFLPHFHRPAPPHLSVILRVPRGESRIRYRKPLKPRQIIHQQLAATLHILFGHSDPGPSRYMHRVAAARLPAQKQNRGSVAREPEMLLSFARREVIIRAESEFIQLRNSDGTRRNPKRS
jgi:hypothetical protein